MTTDRHVSSSLRVQGVRFAFGPCGCRACDNGVQPGHYACEQPNQRQLFEEAQGWIVRVYDEGLWKWIITASGEEAADLAERLGR